MRRVNAAILLNRTCVAVAAASAFAIAASLNAGEASRGAQREHNTVTSGAGDLQVLQLRPHFSMIAGAGANIAVQVGDDGVVVVDAGSAANGEEVVAAIKRITARPIRYVIDTSAEADHVGGNEAISKAGQTLFMVAPDAFRGASVLSFETVLARMGAPTGQPSPFPAAANARHGVA